MLLALDLCLLRLGNLHLTCQLHQRALKSIGARKLGLAPCPDRFGANDLYSAAHSLGIAGVETLLLVVFALQALALSAELTAMPGSYRELADSLRAWDSSAWFAQEVCRVKASDGEGESSGMRVGREVKNKILILKIWS